MTIPFKQLEEHIERAFGSDIDDKFKARLVRQMNAAICFEEDCTRERANGSKRCQPCTDYYRKWGKSEKND